MRCLGRVRAEIRCFDPDHNTLVLVRRGLEYRFPIPDNQNSFLRINNVLKINGLYIKNPKIESGILHTRMFGELYAIENKAEPSA